MRISDWSSDVCSSDLQVDQHRNVAAAAIGQHGIFEQYRRAALGQQAGLDFGHLQRGRHWLGYPYQPAARFELRHELAARGIGHVRLSPVWSSQYRGPKAPAPPRY